MKEFDVSLPLSSPCPVMWVLPATTTTTTPQQIVRVVLTELGKLSVELSESFVLIVWGGAKHSVFSEC